MGGSEAGEMNLHRESSSLDDNKVVEFVEEEEGNPTPPSPVEDVLVDMEETAEKLFFSDEDDSFPSLADFPCLSSPSASPSLSSEISFRSKPVPYLSTKASSSNYSETDTIQSPPLPPAAAESEDRLVPEDAGIDIIGEDEIDLWETCIEEPIESKWDPSSFLSEETATEEKVGFLYDGNGCSSEDLASVFLDWLKRNKDSISPEDLKSIKLKRSTIDCAARRLGGGRQGRVQLLKLILSWVQNHHLQRGRRRSNGSQATGRDREFQNFPSPPPINSSLPFSQEATTYNHNMDFCYEAVPSNSWMPYTCESSFPQVMPVHRGKAVPPYHYYQNQAFSVEPWQQSLTPAVSYSPFGQTPPPSASATPYLPVYYPGLMSSATKEARKKRMARHRRSSSLHHHRSQQQQRQPNQQQHQSLETVVLAEESSSAHSDAHKDNPSNCSLLSYLPADIPSLSPAAEVAVAPSFPTMAQMQEENKLHKHVSSAGDRRRDDAQDGIKADKNYRFLLQKVLKQSDVGSLGRIVLPKKEAEINLPELDARDGISIEMEDIGTSRVWNMRYRFWPNNKSRMYLLENTGGFVRSNGLQEGDFIVIYSDVKCGKYMIRGVKVRQPVLDVMKGGSSRNSGKALQKPEKSSSNWS